MRDPFCVLLVDDNPADLFLAREAFGQRQDQVGLSTCESAAEALAHLRNPERRLPDVVITDLNMPGMSGLELVQAMKADPALQLIPVVVLSTSGNSLDVEAAYNLHVSSYMVKASGFEAFVEQVDAFISFWLQARVATDRRPTA